VPLTIPGRVREAPTQHRHQHDVLRLEIAVDNPLLVRLVEELADGPDDLEEHPLLERAGAEAGLQGLPV
jgi:hypothetical protein